MSQPYVGEIRMFGGNFYPAGWMFCEGQLLPISEYETLFNLIGTTYGGDGQNTFGLPDLRGRVPLHPGTGGGATYVLAEQGGLYQVTLNTQQIPAHTHAVFSTASGQGNSPVQNVSYPASATPTPNRNVYGPQGSNPATLYVGTITNTGNSLPHDNMQPYLAINFIISLFGIYPSPN